MESSIAILEKVGITIEPPIREVPHDVPHEDDTYIQLTLETEEDHHDTFDIGENDSDENDTLSELIINDSAQEDGKFNQLSKANSSYHMHSFL